MLARLPKQPRASRQQPTGVAQTVGGDDHGLPGQQVVDVVLNLNKTASSSVKADWRPES